MYWFLRQRCEDIGYCDYKPTEFYFVVTKSDFLYENFVCDIASNKQIKTREIFNLN